MPFVSNAQRKFFNVNRAKLESQGVNVDEWNSASKGLKLPEHHRLAATNKKQTKPRLGVNR